MEIVRGLRRGLLPAVVKMMRRAIRNFGRRNWIRPTILLLTVCHLGRFYADAPLALAICFDHNHPALAAHHESVAALSASAATDHHSHNHAVAGKRASGVAGVPGVIVAHDATAPGANAQRVLGAMIPFGGSTWFFKVSGPDATITKEKAAFLAYLETVKPATNQ